MDFQSYTGYQCLGYVLMEDHTFTHVGENVTRDFLMENPINCRWRILYRDTNAQNFRTPRISMYRTIKQLEQKKELEPLTYSSTVSAGPQIYTYAKVGVRNIGSGTSPGNVTLHANVRITYYCKLFDRANMDA